MAVDRTALLNDTRVKLILQLVRAIQPIDDLTMLHSLVFLSDSVLADKSLPRFQYKYVNRRGSPYSSELTTTLKELDLNRRWICYDRTGIHLTPKGQEEYAKMDFHRPGGLDQSRALLDELLSHLHDKDRRRVYVYDRASRYVRNPIGHTLELAKTGT